MPHRLHMPPSLHWFHSRMDFFEKRKRQVMVTESPTAIEGKRAWHMIAVKTSDFLLHKFLLTNHNNSLYLKHTLNDFSSSTFYFNTDTVYLKGPMGNIKKESTGMKGNRKYIYMLLVG